MTHIETAARAMWIADGGRPTLWDDKEGAEWRGYMVKEKEKWIALATAALGAPSTYTIGPLTMRYVFERAGLENMADMQAVMDAVEDGIKEAMLYAEVRGIEWECRRRDDD